MGRGAAVAHHGAHNAPGGVLRRALQDALRWELIDRNPCDAVIAPRRAEVEMRAWDGDQVRAFLAHVNGD